MRFACFDRRWAPWFVAAFVLANVGCDDRPTKPQIHAEAVPDAPPYPELAWAEVAKHIEAGDVTWIVPAQDRRVFVTLKNGNEHVTTAPSDDAVDGLVKRVDPSGQTIVVAHVYKKYKEILWRDIPAFLNQYKVYELHQNGRRRVLMQVVDGENSLSFYVTLQPRFGDITRLVPEKYANGMYVKQFNVREVTWQAATEELMLKNVKHVSFVHGGLMYLYTNDDRRLLTVEPSFNEGGRWLAKYRPDFQDITVE